MKTKFLEYLVLCLAVLGPGSLFSQEPEIEITPAPAPQRAFKAEIPDRSLWRIRVNRLAGGDGKASDRESPKASGRQIKEIELAYASGLRREIVRYGNNTETVRFIDRTLVVHLDPETQELLFDDPEDRMTGRISGFDRWGELSWVSPRFFIGTAFYRGRQCDVYRQFARPLQPGEQFEEGNRGLSARELNGQEGEILMTAYIDSETLIPIALDKGFETLLYERVSPYEPFSLPLNVREAIQQRAETIKRREQRFNISK